MAKMKKMLSSCFGSIYGYGTYSLWRFITADRNKGT